MKLQKRYSMHKPRSLFWLTEKGCELGPTLSFIYRETQGDPCRECNCGNTCPALKADEAEYQTEVVEIRAKERYKREHPHGAETNAEMATRLGITKRQAAKLRKRENQ